MRRIQSRKMKIMQCLLSVIPCPETTARKNLSRSIRRLSQRRKKLSKSLISSILMTRQALSSDFFKPRSLRTRLKRQPSPTLEVTKKQSRLRRILRKLLDNPIPQRRPLPRRQRLKLLLPRPLPRRQLTRVQFPTRTLSSLSL